MTSAAGTSNDLAALPRAPQLTGQVEPSYASWTRRVVAAVLDGAIGTGVAFLALGDQAITVPFVGAMFLSPGVPDATVAWTASGWVIAVVAVLNLMQAYLGATPGKLVVGIAVVRSIDARPIGVVRTFVRSLAHILDSFLLIGYLRPLWQAERRTFADSLLGTVALETRRPRRHRWFAGSGDTALDPGPPASWEAGSAPRWWAAATALSVVACAVGVLFAYGPTSGTSAGGFSIACSTTVVGDGPVRLTGGTLSADSGPATTTRWGVTRDATRSTAAPVATWEWKSVVGATGELTLRSTFARADGTGIRHFDFALPAPADGSYTSESVPGGSMTGESVPRNSVTGSLAEGNSATMSLPADALAGLGNSWTWTQTIVVDGAESTGCAASSSGSSA